MEKKNQFFLSFLSPLTFSFLLLGVSKKAALMECARHALPLRVISDVCILVEKSGLTPVTIPSSRLTAKDAII